MQDQPLCIIVELMEFGDMKEYLRANHSTAVGVQLKMAFDVTAGLVCWFFLGCFNGATTRVHRNMWTRAWPSSM